MPTGLSAATCHVCFSLSITKSERLGSKPEDVVFIKSHQWFAGFDWAGIYAGESYDQVSEHKSAARDVPRKPGFVYGRGPCLGRLLLVHTKPAPSALKSFTACMENLAHHDHLHESSLTVLRGPQEKVAGYTCVERVAFGMACHPNRCMLVGDWSQNALVLSRVI